MTQITLFAPDVTCDHCIATIRETTGKVDGVSFVAGDPESKSFVVDLESGEALDRLAAALNAEGYPLGDATPALAAHLGGDDAVGGAFAPDFTVERSERGAKLVYNCPCGSTTEEYEFDRSKQEQEVGSCCDHHLLVGPNAAERLRSSLGDEYTYDTQMIEMPWGQPLQAAFASRS